VAAYLYTIRMRIILSLTYRFEVIATVGTNLILMVTSVYLWKYAYRGNVSMEGLSGSMMATYVILAAFLACIFECDVQNRLNHGVTRGTIAADLLRPVNLLAVYFFEDLGSSITSIFNKALPVLILGALAFGLTAPVSLLAFLLFLLSCALSFGILWLLSALVGLTSFWLMELGNMGYAKDAIVRILSGSLIPLWFFPTNIQAILAYLPFQYTYQTPLGIYIGRIPIADAIGSLLIQAVWIIALSFVTALCWSRARRKLMIQGG
jgi:ABC-2 type transport system permease protein